MKATASAGSAFSPLTFFYGSSSAPSSLLEIACYKSIVHEMATTFNQKIACKSNCEPNNGIFIIFPPWKNDKISFEILQCVVEAFDGILSNNGGMITNT